MHRDSLRAGDRGPVGIDDRRIKRNEVVEAAILESQLQPRDGEATIAGVLATETQIGDGRTCTGSQQSLRIQFSCWYGRWPGDIVAKARKYLRISNCGQGEHESRY